jgi:hypothetical protein
MNNGIIATCLMRLPISHHGIRFLTSEGVNTAHVNERVAFQWYESSMSKSNIFEFVEKCLEYGKLVLLVVQFLGCQRLKHVSKLRKRLMRISGTIMESF